MSAASGRAGAHRRNLGRIAPPALLSILFLLLAVRTWRRLGDPMIDFGREAYMAWRLAQGASPVQDVVSLFGPLPIVVNATLWRLGGENLTPILIANLVVAGLAAGALYLTSRRVFLPWTSTVLAIVFLVTCAFAQLRPFGAFNFAAPYAHAATHGALFAFVSLALLVGHARKPNRLLLAAGALSAGATWLLKPEIAVAATAGVLTTVLVSSRRGWREMLAAAAVLLPGAGFLAIGALVAGVPAAVETLLRPWLFARAVPADAAGFYALVSGLNAPGENLVIGVGLAALFGCLVAVLVTLDLVTARAGRAPRLLLGLLAYVATFLCLFLTSAWLGLGPAMPYLLAIVIVGLLRERRKPRGRPDSPDGTRSAALLVWAVVSLALLGKVLLRTRLDHYGFYLAAPGLLLLLGILLEEIPRRVGRGRSAGGTVTALGSLGVATAIIAGSVQTSEHWLARKSTRLGTGGDALYVLNGSVDPRPVPIREAVRLARTETETDQSVLVVPEGGIVNYLARRRSPIATSSLLPPEIAAVGSERMLRDLEEDPPEIVFLSSRPLADYGNLAPGSDPSFGAEILRWIETRYAPETSLFDAGSEGARYELLVLRPRGRSVNR